MADIEYKEKGVDYDEWQAQKAIQQDLKKDLDALIQKYNLDNAILCADIEGHKTGAFMIGTATKSFMSNTALAMLRGANNG